MVEMGTKKHNTACNELTPVFHVWHSRSGCVGMLTWSGVIISAAWLPCLRRSRKWGVHHCRDCIWGCTLRLL